MTDRDNHRETRPKRRLCVLATFTFLSKARKRHGIEIGWDRRARIVRKVIWKTD